MNDVFRKWKNSSYVKKNFLKKGDNYEDNNNSLHIVIVLTPVKIVGRSYFLNFILNTSKYS